MAGVEYQSGEGGFYGKNLFQKDTDTIGRVDSVNSFSRRVSGEILGQARNFTDAYCIDGGFRWGHTCIPRVGDIVSLSFDSQGIAYARPLTVNMGALVKGGRAEMADSGFFYTDGGELHSHSFGNAETYYDNMGSWRTYTGKGDYIHLDSVDGGLYMKAHQFKVEEYGAKADGSPAVEIEMGYFGVTDSGTEFIPDKSVWGVTVNNTAYIDVSEDGAGSFTVSGPNNSTVLVDGDGVTVIGPEIKVIGDSVDIESDNITHNSGDEPIVLGNVWGQFMSQLITAITSLTVPTGVGPSGTPINSAAFVALKTNFIDNGLIFSDKSKVAK